MTASTQLVTDKGKLWKQRIDAAKVIFEKRAAKWEYLRALYLSTYDGVKELVSWSDTVAMAWSIVSSMIDDTYFQNPETFIQPRSGDPNDDLARELTDVTNTTHKDADTEGIVRQAMHTSTWAGFALHWAYFEEQQNAAYEPVNQRICGEYVSPFDYIGDPEGRRWDWKDFRWMGRRYFIYLQDALDSEFFTTDGKRMLQEWAKHQNSPSPSERAADFRFTEEDPRHVKVWMWEIWSRADDHTIIHMPIDAEFHVSPDDDRAKWPIEFVEADDWPGTLVAFNRIPENKDRTEGWFAKPDLELVEDQLEEINRLYGIMMEAATLSTLKYLFVEGLLSGEEWKQIENDKTRTGVAVNLTKVKEHLQAAGFLHADQFSLRDLIMLLPQEERAAMVKHEEAIERVMNTISEVLGQGPAARYGLAPARTATESAGMQAAKDQRAKSRANQAGQIYDRITAKIWLLLKSNATLPIPYFYSTGDVQGIWKNFHAQKVKNIDLAYRHRVGSSRARDIQGEIFTLKETAAIALPVLQANGNNDACLEIIARLCYLQGVKLTALQPGVKDLAIQLGILQGKIMRGDLDPASPEVVHARSELTSQLISAAAGNDGMQKIAQKVSEGGPGQPNSNSDGPGGGGVASAPSPATAGEAQAMAGAAGAGMTNTMGG